MLHRDIKTITSLGTEIIYLDESTGEQVSGVVGRVEYVDNNTAFVYIVSPYKDENVHMEDGFAYKEIMVFDNQPETVNGWHKNDTRARAKNYINR